MPADLDNPAHLNAFLRIIGGELVAENEAPPVGTPESPGSFNPHLTSSSQDTEFVIGADGTVTTSMSRTEGLELRDEPSETKQDHAYTTSRKPQLGHNPEDETSVWIEVAEKSNLGLEDSKYARQCGGFQPRISSPLSRKILTPKSPNTLVKQHSIQSQRAPFLNKEDINGGRSFEEAVIAKFRSQHEGKSELKEHFARPTGSSDETNGAERPLPPEMLPFPAFQNPFPVQGHMNGTENSAELDEAKVQRIVKVAGLEIKHSPASEVTTPNLTVDPAAKKTVLEGAALNPAIEVTAAELKTAEITIARSPTEETPSKPTVEAAPPKPAHHIKTEENPDEERENLTYFRSWGTPPARNKPKSRVRKVILSYLPVTTDYNLVQSLIHGGAIESIRLISPTDNKPSSAAAQVLFTSGDAAEAYYVQYKYPNTLPFKFQGKKYAASVDIGRDVDVISGVMEGYLDCGGSRVVRASGADEDWTMRALKTLAEAKGSRKVESIMDTYRDEIRTIVFRFTNIPDAVQFKGQLIRDVDWEGANVQFMDDPCEKATGVHME